MVNLTLRVLSRPDTAKLPVIVQNQIGGEHNDLISSISNSQYSPVFTLNRFNLLLFRFSTVYLRESDAAILISEATAAAGMGLVELRRIEASREVAGTLAKSPNVTYLPGGNNMMMALNPAG
ncbi:hypothetical protein RYX36_007075 [Vicia faba]